MVKITTSITLDIIRVLKNHINCRNSFLFLLESFVKISPPSNDQPQREARNLAWE